MEFVNGVGMTSHIIIMEKNKCLKAPTSIFLESYSKFHGSKPPNKSGILWLWDDPRRVISKFVACKYPSI